MPKSNLDELFAPRSIAVIGVSQDTSKLGYVIYSNLLDNNFGGLVFPVNPKYSEIYGASCYADLQSIPGKVDLAVLAIPAERVLEVIKDCSKKGIHNVIVISAGFGETGEEGKELEAKLYKLAEANQINILGPNCLGLINIQNGQFGQSVMNASFAPFAPDSGDIAFASQSGAVCTALLDMAAVDKLGFTQFVSLGNKGSVNENDLLERWLIDPQVKVIGMYLEEFADGFDFVKLKNKLHHEKPIVVISPGISKGAQAAISSHTGSMASSSLVISSALEKYGISQVQDISSLYSLLQYFSWGKLPQGNRVGIITNAGGAGIIATDLIAEHGLELSEIDESVQKSLRENLPLAASTRNPVDVIGDASADRYKHALKTLVDVAQVDLILLILSPQLVTEIEDTARLIIDVSKHTDKPIIPVFIGGKYVQFGLQRLRDKRIPAFTSVETAVRILEQAVKYSAYLKQKENQIKVTEIQPSRRQRSLGRPGALSELEVNSLLSQFKIQQPANIVTTSSAEAVKFWLGNNGPVVIKATTQSLAHKTEKQAVILHLNTEVEVEKAFRSLQTSLARDLKASPEKVSLLVQSQIDVGEEFFVGVNRDGYADVYEPGGKGFGHLLLFGKGGIYTEIYGDYAAGLLPLNLDELTKLVSSTKISQIITGARGKPPLAMQSLLEMLLRLQKLIITYPEIKEVDINPLVITQRECIALDTKIFIG